jgi:hypothetical protein
MELHISLAEGNCYNTLADGCHEICYQTGACFEWVYPEVERMGYRGIFIQE